MNEWTHSPSTPIRLPPTALGSGAFCRCHIHLCEAHLGSSQGDLCKLYPQLPHVLSSCLPVRAPVTKPSLPAVTLYWTSEGSVTLPPDRLQFQHGCFHQIPNLPQGHPKSHLLSEILPDLLVVTRICLKPLCISTCLMLSKILRHMSIIMSIQPKSETL